MPGASAAVLRGPNAASAPTAHSPGPARLTGPLLRGLTGTVVAALATTLGCPSCAARACGPSGLCAPCEALLRSAVASLPVPNGHTAWLGPHAGIWRRLVHALKYRHARRLAGFLAELLHVRTASWGWQAHLVVHLPTTLRRRRQRTYDQAELLAAALARHSGLPHRSALHRHGDSVKLVGQGRVARAASLAHAFTAEGVAGCTVLLVDDVLTSGASLASARAALLAAGAIEVRAAVVARTAPPNLEGAALAAALARLEPPATGPTPASEGYQ